MAVDLSSPSINNVQLLRQWLQVRKYPATIPAGGWFAQQGYQANDQIVQLTSDIVAHGTRYYREGVITISVIKLARKLLQEGHGLNLTPLQVDSLVTGQPLLVQSWGVESGPVVPAAVTV